MTPPDPLGLLGQILDGQYRVERFVGEGGFGVVYAGQHLGLSEPIAIKCMKLPAQLSPALVESFVQRFRDESRLHYKLSQGNLHIARTIAAGTTVAPATRELVPYMILEWLDGRSLAAEFEARQTRTLAEVLELFATAADALSYAQAQGVIHRDLNPGNFFLTNTIAGPRLKVLDFGVAKVLDESRLAVGPRAQTLGQIRIFAPAYGAPEQFDDRLGPVGAYTDVYALALVLLEAMAGRTVMTGEHLGDFANGALDPATRPSPSRVGLSLPAEVEGVFARALSLRPAERWPGVKEFWAALRAAARLPSDDGAKATQLLASMELGGAPPESGPPSDSTLVDSIAEESERTALGLGPAFGGPAPRAAALEPAPMTARIGPTTGAERASSVPTGVPTFLGQGPAAPVAAQVVPGSGPHDPARPSHASHAAISAPAPWAQGEGRPSAAPTAGHATGPHAAPPPAAEPARRPPAAHSATLAMSSRPSLEPQPPAPAPGLAPVMARQAPLAATMAMPRAPTVPTSPALGPTAPAPLVGPPATQALALAPAPGVGLVVHASRESEGAQRASVASVGPVADRASAPAWGPELPPQPFVPAAPPPVVEEPVELPKSRAGLVVLGVIAAAAVLGLGIFLALRVSKPSAHVEPDAASIFAVPDAASAAVAPSAAPSTTPSAEPPSAPSSAPSAAPSASAEPASATAEPGATAPPPSRPPSNPGPAKPPPPPPGPGAFSPAVARAKLDAANGVLVICKRAGGPSGRGSAAVTFAPAGNVSSVVLTVPFVGTPVGACVTGQLLRVKVPAFTGGPQPVAYTFTVPK